MCGLRRTLAPPFDSPHTTDIGQRMAVITLLAEKIGVADEHSLRFAIKRDRLKLALIQAIDAAVEAES